MIPRERGEAFVYLFKRGSEYGSRNRSASDVLANGTSCHWITLTRDEATPQYDVFGEQLHRHGEALGIVMEQDRCEAADVWLADSKVQLLKVSPLERHGPTFSSHAHIR